MNTEQQPEPRLLEVGDTLAAQSRYGGWYFYPIDRVTAKRAFSESRQFEREMRPSHWLKGELATREIGGSHYETFQFATQELIESDRLNRLRWELARKVKAAPFDSFSLETLQTVAAILFPENPETK